MDPIGTSQGVLGICSNGIVGRKRFSKSRRQYHDQKKNCGERSERFLATEKEKISRRAAAMKA